MRRAQHHQNQTAEMMVRQRRGNILLWTNSERARNQSFPVPWMWTLQVPCQQTLSVQGSNCKHKHGTSCLQLPITRCRHHHFLSRDLGLGQTQSNVTTTVSVQEYSDAPGCVFICSFLRVTATTLSILLLSPTNSLSLNNDYFDHNWIQIEKKMALWIFSYQCKLAFVCNGPITFWLIEFGNQIDHIQRNTVSVRASFIRLPFVVLFSKPFQFNGGRKLNVRVKIIKGTYIRCDLSGILWPCGECRMLSEPDREQSNFTVNASGFVCI